MVHILENDELKVEIDSYGAEIKSIINKKTGINHIWCGDPEVWGRTAPVLFPFVGSCNHGKYRFEGTEYSMPSHGFARDKEHALSSKSDNEIWFCLVDTAETYNIYPFHFKFECGYKLDENNIYVSWKVTNPGQERNDKNLYFSLGAHPAFVCPLNGEPNKVGYKLYFEGINEIRHHGNLTGTCTHEDLVLELENNRAVITPEFFERSTYIIENKQTGKVGIESPDGSRFVTMTFDTPLFAVWSPAKKNAPFICIEPWFGRADYDDFDGDLTQREYGNVLGESEIFENTYTITIG